jgi:hypothetical protein
MEGLEKSNWENEKGAIVPGRRQCQPASGPLIRDMFTVPNMGAV